MFFSRIFNLWPSKPGFPLDLYRIWCGVEMAISWKFRLNCYVGQLYFVLLPFQSRRFVQYPHHLLMIPFFGVAPACAQSLSGHLLTFIIIQKHLHSFRQFQKSGRMRNDVAVLSISYNAGGPVGRCCNRRKTTCHGLNHNKRTRIVIGRKHEYIAVGLVFLS
jgi:hypothetical protein